MLNGLTIYIALVFVLAGVVKGATGLGLRTVSMGLLAIVMTPLQAELSSYCRHSSPISGNWWPARRSGRSLFAFGR